MLKVITVIISIVSVVKCLELLNLDKACTTCAGYNLKGLCPTNLDITSDTASIIKRHGYRSETHKIITADSYELTMFRIFPKLNNSNNIPVLIQHGLQMDSTIWVVVGSRSLGYRLADMGYDVWLGNYRGTPHSRLLDVRHNRQPFNYSLDELGLYDIPAMTEFISLKTEQEGNIIYIGHSMGVSGIMVYAAALPEHSQKYLKGIIGLAPAVFFHLSKAIIAIKPVVDFTAIAIRDLLSIFGYYAVLDNGRFTKSILISLCTFNAFTCEFCRSFVQTFVGLDIEQFLPQDVPLVYSFCAFANPIKIQNHFMLIAKYKNFVPYYHGQFGNNEVYDLTRIKLPVHLLYGVHDNLADPADVQHLYDTLTTPVKTIQGVALSGAPPYNHIDFVFAKDIDFLHVPLFKLVKSLSGNGTRVS